MSKDKFIQEYNLKNKHNKNQFFYSLLKDFCIQID